MLNIFRTLNIWSDSIKTKTVIDVYSAYLKHRSKILDVGCGDGIITKALADSLEIRMTGCDIIPYTLNNIPFVQINKPDRLPFKNLMFDTVIFTDVLHHTPFDIQKSLIAEAIRVAKHQVLIYEPVPTVSAYFFDFVLNKITHPRVPVPLTLRRSDEWVKLIPKNGLKTEVIVLPRKSFSFFRHILIVVRKRELSIPG